MNLAVFQRWLVFCQGRKSENQIVLTIGALLHYTDVELQIRTSCLLFTVSPLTF